MVQYIIRADILLIARIFPRPCGARKNTTQLAKYPHVFNAKPSNKVYITIDFHYFKRDSRLSAYRVVMLQRVKDDFQSELRSLRTLMFINIITGALDGMRIDVIR